MYAYRAIQLNDMLDVYPVVEFVVDEVDSHIMRIVSVLHKLQYISNYVIIHYARTIELIKSIWYVNVNICYQIDKFVLLNQLH